MLPLAGQGLARTHPGADTLPLSSCIMVAQLVMTGIAVVVGRALNRVWPQDHFRHHAGGAAAARRAVRVVHREPRASWQSRCSMAWRPDFRRRRGRHRRRPDAGTGRFDLAQGLVALSVGIGASLSNLTSGFVVEWFGYRCGFLYLAAIALGGLIFCAALMPETQLPETAGGREGHPNFQEHPLRQYHEARKQPFARPRFRVAAAICQTGPRLARSRPRNTISPGVDPRQRAVSPQKLRIFGKLIDPD